MMDPEVQASLEFLAKVMQADVLRLHLTIRHKERAIVRRLDALEGKVVPPPSVDSPAMESAVAR